MTIKEYLDSLDLDASVKLHATSFIEEIDKFCNKNKNRLNELPSAGQLEQLKNENKDLIEYIIKQSEKSTNRKWRTKVKDKDQNREVEEVMFYEFLIKKIFGLGENENNSEKLKLMIKYFIEYLVDHIKMSRKDKK